MLFASSASNDCECTNTLAHNTRSRATCPYLLHVTAAWLRRRSVSAHGLLRASQLICGSQLICELHLSDLTAAHELDICDWQLSLRLGDAPEPLLLSFVVPVRSSEATARRLRQRGALAISAPLLAAEEAAGVPQRLRVTVRGLGRGEHTLRLAASDASSERYVLVSRSGAHATLRGGGYSWCHTVRAGCTAVVCLEAAAWGWEDADSYVTHGLFSSGEATPRAAVDEANDEEDAVLLNPAYELLGVTFATEEEEPAAAAADGGAADGPDDAPPPAPVAWTFAPEAETLPTAELRQACRLFEASFAGVDGHAALHAYMDRRPRSPPASSPGISHPLLTLPRRPVRRPPPPVWTDARGGAVVDQHYSSLTFGEAEFAPLFHLLRLVGVPAGARVVDLARRRFGLEHLATLRRAA